MPARTFEDSTGTVWEVFEVHRSSHNALAVSAGLELGWLAFVSGPRKRRLAPFPSGWQTADTAELERLCQRARVANQPGYTRAIGGRTNSATEATDATDSTNALDAADERSRVPRLRRGKERTGPASAVELPIGATATSADPVEQTVRAFAQQAREHQLPAIEAMVRLKGLLTRVYTSATSEARDLRAVRRWFVESYYFERDAPTADGTDQSR